MPKTTVHSANHSDDSALYCFDAHNSTVLFVFLPVFLIKRLRDVQEKKWSPVAVQHLRTVDILHIMIYTHGTVCNYKIHLVEAIGIYTTEGVTCYQTGVDYGSLLKMNIHVGAKCLCEMFIIYVLTVFAFSVSFYFKERFSLL